MIDPFGEGDSREGLGEAEEWFSMLLLLPVERKDTRACGAAFRGSVQIAERRIAEEPFGFCTQAAVTVIED